MSADQMRVVKMADLLDGGSRFWNYLKRRILFVTLLTSIAVLLALGYYFFQKPNYAGTVKFILEEKSGGMGGGLSNIASQIGFDIGGLSGSSGMFAGDNILDILKSRSIVEKVLLSKVDTAKGSSGATLADLYLDVSKWKLKWKNEDPELANVSFSGLTPNTPHSMVQDSVLYLLYERLYKKHLTAERFNKKGSIIKMMTESPHPVFSKLMSERLVIETKKLYIDVKTGISTANVARLEKRADSLMRIMNAKSYQSASQQVLDANAAFKTAIVPAEVSQRDRMVTYAIYTEVMKNLEASRMAVAGQTPVIQLLDTPRYPLDDQKKSLSFLLLAGLLGGLALSIGVAFFQYPSQQLPPNHV